MYVRPEGDDSNSAYITSLVFWFGSFEDGNASSSIEARNSCSRDCLPLDLSSFCRALIFFLIFVRYVEFCVGDKIFVDCRCWRVCDKCPFAVHVEGWRCFFTNFSDSPGHVLKKPFSMACNNVDFTGPKHAACRYSARSVEKRIMAPWRCLYED